MNLVDSVALFLAIASATVVFLILYYLTKSRIDDAEKFKNHAAGLQSIAISIAIFIGGIWALYEFRVNKESRELDKRSSAQYSLDSEIINMGPSLGDRSVRLTATISNQGDRAFLVVFNDNPLQFARMVRMNKEVKDSQSMATKWGTIPQNTRYHSVSMVPPRGTDYGYASLISTLIPPKVTRTFEFLVKYIRLEAHEYGVFLATLRFDIVRSNVEQRAVSGSGENFDESFYLKEGDFDEKAVTSAFVIVSPEAKISNGKP